MISREEARQLMGDNRVERQAETILDYLEDYITEEAYKGRDRVVVKMTGLSDLEVYLNNAKVRNLVDKALAENGFEFYSHISQYLYIFWNDTREESEQRYKEQTKEEEVEKVEEKEDSVKKSINRKVNFSDELLVDDIKKLFNDRFFTNCDGSVKFKYYDGETAKGFNVGFKDGNIDVEKLDEQ